MARRDRERHDEGLPRARPEDEDRNVTRGRARCGAEPPQDGVPPGESQTELGSCRTGPRSGRQHPEEHVDHRQRDAMPALPATTDGGRRPVRAVASLGPDDVRTDPPSTAAAQAIDLSARGDGRMGVAVDLLVEQARAKRFTLTLPLRGGLRGQGRTSPRPLRSARASAVATARDPPRPIR